MAILYHHIASSNSDDHSVISEPQLSGDVSFIKGASIGASLPQPLVFEVDHPARESLPHFVGRTIPVFSTRLVEAFRSAGVENFEVFPAVLRNPAIGAQWDGYWAFNVIGLLSAADLDASQADTIMGGDLAGLSSVPLLAFKELVLELKKTRGIPMFRLAESPATLLIHERVLAHIKARRPEGGWGFEATGIETV
jgi:hypothetical protein